MRHISKAGDRRQAARLNDVLAKRRWDEDDARVVIDALTRSGETVATFSGRHGLNRLRLWRWRTRVGGAETAAGVTKLASVFPVAVRDDDGVTAPPASRIEVALPDGLVVRLASDFDASSLRRLLAVLGC